MTKSTTARPKPTFTLTLEPMPGTDPEECSIDAQRLADRFTVAVEFNFNGVVCWAYPGGDAARLATNIHTMISTAPTRIPRMAFS